MSAKTLFAVFAIAAASIAQAQTTGTPDGLIRQLSTEIRSRTLPAV